MTVGVVALGLIGGSFAKAYHEAGHRVLACDIDRSVLDFAIMEGTVEAELTGDNAHECDLILICVYPMAAARWLEDMAPHIGDKCVVIDCCGTKQQVCQACFAIAKDHGIRYIGGHPMAGTHNWGYKYARANMFSRAPMVLVPYDRDDIMFLQQVKTLLAPAGFGRYTVTTAYDHDRMIAFTSQLAHLVSNAYVKSPTAREHKGFSAGSYKDLTRVAWLNPQMWAQLFMDNKDCLLYELDSFIASLNEYKTAMEKGDLDALVRILDEGRRIKEEVDGR